MEEIIKRLEILKLSISLKDIESVDLQMRKLEALNINQQVKNILALIKNGHNYKAVISINAYPNELYTNEYYSKVKAEEEALIEEFELFENSPIAPTNLVVENPVVEKVEREDDILDELKEEEAQLNKIKEEEKLEKEEPTVIKNSWFMEEEQKEDITEEEQKEVVQENVEEAKETEEKENIQEEEKVKDEEESKLEDNDKIDLDKGLDESNNYNSWYHDNKLENQIDDKNPLSYTKDYTFEEEEEKIKDNNTYDYNLIINDDLDDIVKDYYRQKTEENKSKVFTPLEDDKEVELQDEDGFYQPIQFLEQKFENIIKRFPQKEPIESQLDSIKHLIAMFEQPYRDEDVEIALKQFDEFKKNEELEEAGKILLLVSISDSKIVHFALSRELFKGDVLEQNYAEAFIQMNDLALEGFVEAICDLGQFYEYGIGVKKDRKKAISLYEEAMKLDLERAKELRDKLQNAKKSFFSYLFD